MVKNLLAIQDTEEIWVWSLDQEDPLEEGMATYSSILFFFFILTVFNESCRQDDFILKIWSASRICVSSLRRGHANLLCIVPILVYALPKRAHYSSILAWRFPWTEKPGGLQSMESQRVGHNWAHTHVAKSTTLAAFKSRRVELIPAILPMM